MFEDKMYSQIHVKCVKFWFKHKNKIRFRLATLAQLDLDLFTFSHFDSFYYEKKRKPVYFQKPVN